MVKNKYLLFIAILFSITTISNSCVDEVLCTSGNGVMVKQTRRIAPFKKIDLGASGLVYITQGDSISLRVEAQENVLKQLKTNVSGEILKIYFDRCVKHHDGINIYITVTDLNGLKISGAGEITALSYVETQSIDLKISGSGKIVIDTLLATYVDTHISGSGNVFLTGNDTIQHHQMRITGTGEINALDLITNEISIDIPGSGKCRVYALNTLDIDISGVGTVFYKGNPVINRKFTGVGTLINSN